MISCIHHTYIKNQIWINKSIASTTKTKLRVHIVNIKRAGSDSKVKGSRRELMLPVRWPEHIYTFLTRGQSEAFTDQLIMPCLEIMQNISRSKVQYLLAHVFYSLSVNKMSPIRITCCTEYSCEIKTIHQAESPWSLKRS